MTIDIETEQGKDMNIKTKQNLKSWYVHCIGVIQGFKDVFFCLFVCSCASMESTYSEQCYFKVEIVKTYIIIQNK